MRLARGFVSELRLTTAAFLGDDRECQACGGESRVIADDPVVWRWEKCHCCTDGRVVTPGVAAVFSCQPVERVVLTDKRPWQMGSGVRFGWTDDPQDFPGPTDWHIPLPIFEHLPPTQDGYPKNAHRRWYATADLAHAALDAACVRYARRLADPDGRVWSVG